MRIIIRPTTQNKYAEINRRFNELMKRNEMGLRPDIDDVINLLAQQFFCSNRTIERALTTPTIKIPA
jgi:hypothetical protein